MGLMEKLTEGAERAAREAEKAFDKGKSKVSELQIEMQMDSLARRLGYLVFDFYRGRQVDQELRQEVLDDMSRLEEQLLAARAQAAAKAEAQAAAREAAKKGAGCEAAAGADTATTAGAATAEAAASEAGAADAGVAGGNEPAEG